MSTIIAVSRSLSLVNAPIVDLPSPGLLLSMIRRRTGVLIAVTIAFQSLTATDSMKAADDGSVFSLGNLVWHDGDENGIHDTGEAGIGGIIVHLLDCAGTPLATTISQPSGFYLFPLVLPGEYRLQFVVPDGYLVTARQAGSDATRDSDADADGLTHCFAFGGFGNDVNMDAGLIHSGTIQGWAWYDRNRNGIQERRESLLQDVVVYLLDCDGVELASAITGSDGAYRFSDVPVGMYRIGRPSMAGLALTRPNIGSDELDSDLFPQNGLSDCLAIAPGQRQITRNLGIRNSYGCITFGQQDWGAPPEESHLSTLLVDNFSTLYRRGLTLGLSTNQLKFTSAQAIIDFLPAAGPAAVLAAGQVDPLTTEAGEFAGHVLALRLNVDFSLRRKTAKGLTPLRVETGHKLAGLRVTKILVIAQRVLSGRTDLLPEGCTLEDLNDAIIRINQNFDCGMQDLGFLRR